MRRSIHALIVSLLCLTLFVDTAKACWHRRHRSRSHATCRPVTCPSSCSQPVWRDLPPGWDGSMADVVISDRPLYEVHESTGHAGIPVECCVPCDGSAHASVDFATEVFEQPAVAHAAVPKTMPDGGDRHDPEACRTSCRTACRTADASALSAACGWLDSQGR